MRKTARNFASLDAFAIALIRIKSIHAAEAMLRRLANGRF